MADFEINWYCHTRFFFRFSCDRTRFTSNHCLERTVPGGQTFPIVLDSSGKLERATQTVELIVELTQLLTISLESSMPMYNCQRALALIKLLDGWRLFLPLSVHSVYCLYLELSFPGHKFTQMKSSVFPGLAAAFSTVTTTRHLVEVLGTRLDTSCAPWRGHPEHERTAPPPDVILITINYWKNAQVNILTPFFPAIEYRVPWKKIV